MKIKPEFTEAIERHKHLVKTLGMDHPITKQVFMIVMEHTPEKLLDVAHQGAVDMDLMPEASGYFRDGTAMYSLADIAAKYGRTIQQAEQDLQEMMLARRAAGLPDMRKVEHRLIHRKQ